MRRIILFVLALSACASTERNGDVLRFQLRADPNRPRPACTYRFTLDGELVQSGSVAACPVVPMCEATP